MAWAQEGDDAAPDRCWPARRCDSVAAQMRPRAAPGAFQRGSASCAHESRAGREKAMGDSGGGRLQQPPGGSRGCAGKAARGMAPANFGGGTGRTPRGRAPHAAAAADGAVARILSREGGEGRGYPILSCSGEERPLQPAQPCRAKEPSPLWPGGTALYPVGHSCSRDTLGG
ncbi:hypothetical protein DV515_00015465 [Chloebia gouldiae]|uniref:Uncharacterized protein n=1 Tax=Chloebia gouldiae TaxID=44316 RepID=A0A3L8RWS4_CHLGU|nr:hypothetical protein DV515_00015465 [Chloebia gouldiae]